jgi:hypothetical protein
LSPTNAKDNASKTHKRSCMNGVNDVIENLHCFYEHAGRLGFTRKVGSGIHECRQGGRCEQHVKVWRCRNREMLACCDGDFNRTSGRR